MRSANLFWLLFVFVTSCNTSIDLAVDAPPDPPEQRVLVARDSPRVVHTRATDRPAVADTTNHCEGVFTTESNGKIRHRRARYERSKGDIRNTKALIALVASEMGVKHPRFFVDLALHESSWNPEAIHILNPDQEANRRSWERHTYTTEHAQRLERVVSSTSSTEKKHWQAKARLRRIKRYRDNTHWFDDVQVNHVIAPRTLPDGRVLPEETIAQRRNAWGFGYGLYGHNPVLWLPYWDKNAPPWSLCDHEGIVATITQVWAARTATKQCASLSSKDPDRWSSDGHTYQAALRRLARGKCDPATLGSSWRKIMVRSSVPWDAATNFGSRFPRDTTDREEIVQHMLDKARDAGLLRDSPLVLKSPQHAPRVFHDPRHSS
jgi:hypothetical protein